MNKKWIIAITIFVYAAAMTYSWLWGVESFMKNKINKESEYISDQLEAFFYTKNKQFYDVIYSNRDVQSEKTSIPLKPTLSTSSFYDDDDTLRDFMNAQYQKNYAENLEEWNVRYGDVQEMYKLKYWNDENSKAKNGWCLGLIEYKGLQEHSYTDEIINELLSGKREYPDESINLNRDEYTIWFTRIFPYAVGYFEKSYYYRPTVKDAVESAFDFWTNDNNASSYKDDFRNGIIDDFFSKMTEIESVCKYFYFNNKSKPTRISYYNETTLFNQPLKYTYPSFSDNSEEFEKYEQQPLDGSYFWNGYHRVYNAFSRPRYFSFVKAQWKIDSDTISFRIRWSVALTILFLAIIIPLIVTYHQQQKLKSETLYDKLKRLCNPSVFMKNYNKEKIDAANEIYQKLLQTRPNDKESLNEIQQEAVEKLKITLIDKTMLDDLKKKVNPQNYTKNYHAEKVALANDLFSRLTKENLSYNEFVEIQELSKRL